MGLMPLEIFVLLQCGDRLQSTESDVYRRQILLTKVDPRTVRDDLGGVYIQIFFIIRS